MRSTQIQRPDPTPGTRGFYESLTIGDFPRFNGLALAQSSLSRLGIGL